MATIKCGFIGDVANFIKALSSAISQGIDKLIDLGYEVKKSELTDDGGFLLHITTGSGEHKFTIKCTPVPNRLKVFDMEFTSDNNKQWSKKNVKEKDFVKVAQEAALELFGEDSVAELLDDAGNDMLASSNSIQVTLKKVMSSTDCSIHLCAINANYAPGQVLSDLDTILSDDNFIAQITSEPISFDVIDTGDSFEVEERDDVSTADSYLHLLTAAWSLHSGLNYVRWNAAGEYMTNLRAFIENQIWAITSQIDYIAETCVAVSGSVPHPSTFQNSECISTPLTSFTSKQGYQYVQSLLDNYIAAIECYYCNFPSDVQNLLDDWLREWKRQSKYFINQICKV